MARKADIQRTISYRRCVTQPKQTQTLQQLVAAALSAKPKPADRLEPLNTQSSELRFIGHFTTVSNCLCGYLTAFERGATQPVIDDDPSAASLRLSMLAPPAAKKGGVQQQYVPGVVYFAIHNNHVAVIQSATMRTTSLESHLSWLLKERTNQLPATVAFALSDEAQKATREKIKRSHVKRISFGQPLMSEVEAPPPSQDLTQSQASSTLPKSKQAKPPKKFRPGGPALDLLRGYFADDAAFENLGLDGVFDGNLELWIEIRYPKRKRTKPEDSAALMDTLGVSLRDVESDQVVLELEDGNTVKGQELRISSNIDIPVLANKLPDEQKLWDGMVSWLTAQVQNGVVDP